MKAWRPDMVSAIGKPGQILLLNISVTGTSAGRRAFSP
jgi:hypothetical protein